MAKINDKVSLSLQDLAPVMEKHEFVVLLAEENQRVTVQVTGHLVPGGLEAKIIKLHKS